MTTKIEELSTQLQGMVTDKLQDTAEFESKKQELEAQCDALVAKHSPPENTNCSDNELLLRSLDDPDIPSMLFLHDEIVSFYKVVCPALEKYDTLDKLENVIETKNELTKLKTEWLNSTVDSGNTYWKFYNRIFKNSELEIIKARLIELQMLIENLLETVLENEYQEYINIKTQLGEFEGRLVTKKTFKKKQIEINKLYDICKNANLQIDEYLKELFGLRHCLFSTRTTSIAVTKSDTQQLLNSNRNSSLHLFDDYLNEYKTKRVELEQEKRYIENTKKNLNRNFYKHVNNLGITIAKEDTRSMEQEGKYFKRWTILSVDEKNERFMSFSEWYTKKTFGVIKSEQELKDLSEKLYNLLKVSYRTKLLVYRDFTWSNTGGKITCIKTLKYDKDKGEFYLKGNVKKDGSGSSNSRSQIKSIFTKENEGVINNQILTFARKRQQPGDNKKLKHDLEKSLKKKFQLPKLSQSDKKTIWEVYKNMKTEIENIK